MCLGISRLVLHIGKIGENLICDLIFRDSEKPQTCKGLSSAFEECLNIMIVSYGPATVLNLVSHFLL